jgi:CyaY protein
MTSDHEFGQRADAYMAGILAALDELDPDELDCQLAMGVLTMEFADGTKSIMNRQVAAHQIWLAAGANAWHFDFDATQEDWVDTKGRGKLREILRQLLNERLGRSVAL